MADEKQESQKTVVSFIVGLLIGGLLVWAFSGPTVDAPEEEANEQASEESADTEEEASSEEESASEQEAVPAAKATLPVGDGKVVVKNQVAGTSIKLESATYPVAEGWIGVRDYQGGQLGGILGVVRFSEEQGLVPSEIVLQRTTKSGNDYAVVVYTESGDRQFNLADDKQLDSVFATFSAE